MYSVTTWYNMIHKLNKWPAFVPDDYVGTHFFLPLPSEKLKNYSF
jgi:hypothetical protein